MGSPLRPSSQYRGHSYEIGGFGPDALKEARTLPELLVDRDGHITVITLNRPDQLNAFTTAMTRDLTQAMAEFDADPDQYVAIITGAGDRAFSSGRDLKELAASSTNRLEVQLSDPNLWGVGSSPKPTIAAIN